MNSDKQYVVQTKESSGWVDTYWGDCDWADEHPFSSPRKISLSAAKDGLKDAKRFYPDERYRIFPALTRREKS